MNTTRASFENVLSTNRSQIRYNRSFTNVHTIPEFEGGRDVREHCLPRVRTSTDGRPKEFDYRNRTVGPSACPYIFYEHARPSLTVDVCTRVNVFPRPETCVYTLLRILRRNRISNAPPPPPLPAPF